MLERTSMKLLHEGSVNSFLLCAVVSKQTRRLGRLLPEERIAELITMALKDCVDHEFEIQLGNNTPEVIREEAMRMFPPNKIRVAVVGSSPDCVGERQGNAIPVSSGQQAAEGGQEYGASHLFNPAAGNHVFVGNGVDSPDSGRNLYNFQRDYSMSNRKGMDIVHLRQIRAFAENLYLQANRHRENHNYVVAHALYGRALEAAQRIDTPEHKENGSGLVTRIQKDRQTVYELLRLAEGSAGKPALEKAQKVGQ